MAVNPQKQAARKFVEYWTFNRPGGEIRGCQRYWNMLLGEVLGLTDLASAICYEVQLKAATKRLDACIPSTSVLVEQKSRGTRRTTRRFSPPTASVPKRRSARSSRVCSTCTRS